MASRCVFLNVKEYDFETDETCVCCLSQNIALIKINSCNHTAFIQNNITFKLDLQNAHICVVCHTMLKKILVFKQQIEDSFTLLNATYQTDILKVNKLYNINNTEIKTTDSTVPIDNDIEIKPEVIIEEINENDFDTEIKVERDSTDFETETILNETDNKTCEKQIAKYEGKLRVINLTPEQLREERENMAKQEKYLRLPYKCEYCIIGFDHEITWKSHMKKRHTKTKNSFLCDVCMCVLNSKNSYYEHTKRHLKRFECLECGKRYALELSASQHYDEKHLPPGSSLRREYTCKLCGFMTTLNRAYRYHLDKHKKKLECTLCLNTFVNSNSLKRHMYTVHSQSSRVYSCESCNKTYRAPSGLLSHIRSVHAYCPPAHCTQCHTHYPSEAALRAHLTTHSRHVGDKKYICDDCGAKFLRKNSLQTHINSEHLKVMHRCVKCSKMFRSDKSLRRHVDYVHNKLRPPRDKICHFCGRGFTTQSILQSHVRTHTGERPLQCRNCRATFAHSGALYTHIKLKHGGDK